MISDTRPANFSSAWADLQDYVAASWTRPLEVAPAGIRPILTEYPIIRSDLIQRAGNARSALDGQNE